MNFRGVSDRAGRLALAGALVIAAGWSGGPALAQPARQTPEGVEVPVLPEGPLRMPRPSLQPGQPGAPAFAQPQEEPAPTRGERFIPGPILQNAVDAGLNETREAEKNGGHRPAAKAGGAAPPGADLAFGAFQRGYFLTAVREAEARIRANPRDGAAATLLGALYEQGLGPHLDLAKAAEWYRRGAEAGDPAATFALAMMLLQGRGVDQNVAEGRKLLEKAAAASYPQACYNLALLRLNEGDPKSDEAAVALLRQAARQELPEAQYLLATLYRQGRGVIADDIRATALLRRAGANGLLAAEIEYAIALFNGNGVHKDEKGAARLFLKAALLGNALAQNRLARLLAVGRGVERNLVEAAGWHLVAAGQGLADPWLDETLKRLTPAERARAEAFAAAHREPLLFPPS